jgi:DNA-binding NarL/FixJ family response regulator
MSDMGERWLTRLGGAPHAGRIVSVLLALAAFGQAAGQAVTLGFAGGKGADPGLLAFLYAVPLCGLALLSTVPLLFPRPLRAAVVVVFANVLVLAVFPAPTVAGALAAVAAVWWLGTAGSPGNAAGGGQGGWLRRGYGGGLVSVAADYLAVVLSLPFLVLALARHGDVACVLLAWGVPAAAGAGIALRAGRTARTYSEAGEALAGTLLAHTARGERARIARELHDVVAHHISMIAVLAETGRLATPGLPEAGARRFLEIGDTARAALLDTQPDFSVLGTAADGAEAVLVCRKVRPDVVLMDVRMPGTDGISATQQLTAGEAPPKVLILTTFDLDEYVFDALRAGASGFLLKDVTAERLFEAVRVVAAGEALLAPTVTRRLISEFARLRSHSVAGAASTAGRPGALAALTPRETEVLRLVAEGLPNTEIAGRLVVTEETVKTHVSRILSKLGLRDRTQAVVVAYESGLVVPGR